jgi:hypothetical protein
MSLVLVVVTTGDHLGTVTGELPVSAISSPPSTDRGPGLIPDDVAAFECSPDGGQGRRGTARPRNHGAFRTSTTRPTATCIYCACVERDGDRGGAFDVGGFVVSEVS